MEKHYTHGGIICIHVETLSTLETLHYVQPSATYGGTLCISDLTAPCRNNLQFYSSTSKDILPPAATLWEQHQTVSLIMEHTSPFILCNQQDHPLHPMQVIICTHAGHPPHTCRSSPAHLLGTPVISCSANQ
jgi:hypothetical protein